MISQGYPVASPPRCCGAGGVGGVTGWRAAGL